MARRHETLLLATFGAAALLAAGCDAGVEDRAKAAVERRDLAAAPGPAEAILEAHAQEMANTSAAYEAALAAAGYAAALAEGALTSSEEFARAPDRIAAAKKAAAEHRAMALMKTDEAMARLSGLKAGDPARARKVDLMLAELSAMRDRREAHWDHAERIIDETLAAWRTLDVAEGDWALTAEGLKFTERADSDAYNGHAAKINAHGQRQERIMAEQSKSAARLLDLARDYGA